MPVRYQTRCPIRPSVTQVMQKVCLQASSDTPAPTSRLRLTPPGATSSSADFVVFLSFPMLLHPASGQSLAAVPPLSLPHHGVCALLASMHPPVFVQLPHSQHLGNHHQMDTKQTNAFFFLSFLSFLLHFNLQSASGFVLLHGYANARVEWQKGDTHGLFEVLVAMPPLGWQWLVAAQPKLCPGDAKCHLKSYTHLCWCGTEVTRFPR